MTGHDYGDLTDEEFADQLGGTLREMDNEKRPENIPPRKRAIYEERIKNQRAEIKLLHKKMGALRSVTDRLCVAAEDIELTIATATNDAESAAGIGRSRAALWKACSFYREETSE